MTHEQIEIKTPEYVSLQFPLAGLGSRAAALIIDQTILTIASILVIIGLVLVDFGRMSMMYMSNLSSLPIAIAIILIFVINWGYYFIVEFFSGGRTIGKKILGIRVIQENGHSLTFLSSLLRNLLRIIDSLPTAYLVGMLMVFFHSKHKRLGDLVAGTIVVHEAKGKSKKTTPIEREIELRGLSKTYVSFDEWSLKSLVTKDWNLLKTYSKRFMQLPSIERKVLTREIASILLPKVGLDIGDKSFHELENELLVLYLNLKEEWEFEL